jgi:hypothetical protein
VEEGKVLKEKNRSKRVRAQLYLCMLSLAVLSQGFADAQVLYGTLVGTVQDPSRGVVATATVAITNIGTEQSREVVTNSLGEYTLTNVLPGAYTIKVSAPGFKTFAKTGVEISINTVTRVDVQLEIGNVAETITVGAEAPILQADKSDVHVNLASQEITNLPLANYRNYESLIDLVPGASPAKFSNTVDNEPARSLVHNVNGANNMGNNSRVDGATNIFSWLPNHQLYVPPSESIETVNVTTNSFDAEQGLAGGAAISVTTKSGTNQIHAVAFGYNADSPLAARNYFFYNSGTPKNIINMYGGTLGGPIKKDKLFFFVSWEGLRQRQNSTTTISGSGAGLVTVALPDVRAGDFSRYGVQIYDPLTGNLNGTGRSPFPDATIPLARQSSIAPKMQALIPFPNLPGTTANYYPNTTMSFNRDLGDLKINWNRSQKSTFWGKYSVMDALAGDQFDLGPAGGQGLGAVAGWGHTLVQLATLGGTYLVSPTFVIDATAGFTRLAQPVVSLDYGTNFGLETLGIPGTNGPDIRQSGMPWFNVTGYEGFGNAVGWSPSFRYDNSWAYTANANWIKGAHDIRFGADIGRQDLNEWQPEIGGGPRGEFIFTGGVSALSGGPSPNQYNAWADFLLGQPQQVAKTLQFYSPSSTRDWLTGFYVRDRWQATHSLTVTLGMRWEYYPIMTRAHSGIERYDSTTNQVLIGGLGGVPDNAGITTSKRLFAPRVGLAYRLGQRGVIRAGYGISIDPNIIGRPMKDVYPALVGQTYLGVNSFQPFGPLAQGIPLFNGPDISSGVIPLPLTATTTTLPKGLFNRGYIESFNFTVERQLPGDFVANAGYVGTRAIRQNTSININAAPPGGGVAGRPLDILFGRSVDTSYFLPFQTANYNALQTSLDRRFKDGLLVKVAYTWSKAIAYNDDNGALFFNYPTVISRDRAVTSFDRTQVLQAAVVEEVPFGPGKRWAPNRGVAQAVLKGWQINGILSSFTGLPFTVTASSASLNAPGNSQTANQVSPQVQKLGTIGPNSPFYNPLAFAPVTQVAFGNVGRNSMRGPGVVNFNFGIFRIFSLTERVKLQFRGEGLNAFNIPHFQNPGTNASNMSLNPDGSIRSLGGFMAITSALPDQRQIRFGLRLSY